MVVTPKPLSQNVWLVISSLVVVVVVIRRLVAVVIRSHLLSKTPYRWNVEINVEENDVNDVSDCCSSKNDSRGRFYGFHPPKCSNSHSVKNDACNKSCFKIGL